MARFGIVPFWKQISSGATALSEEDWAARHKVVVMVLLVHVPLLFAFGMFGGQDLWFSMATFESLGLFHSFIDASIPLLFALFALLPTLPRRVASSAGVLGLVVTSAVFTHMSGGFVEAHFHFFVMAGLAALYIDWLPFTIGGALVVVHHAYIALLQPTSVFNHELALMYPVRWSIVHIVFLAALGLTQMANIALAQRSIDDVRQEQERGRQQFVHRQAAELAAASRAAFLANMSHEVRTPLNAIIGMTEVIRRDNHPDLAEHLGVIKSSGSHLLAMLDDILDLSKVDSGEVDLHPVPVSLEDIVDQASEMVRPAALYGGLELDVQCSAEGGFLLDPVRVRQVLVNLLNNAVKFTPQGTVAIHARTADDSILFSVRDTGVGMSPEDVASIFAPYRQVKTSEKSTGVGLGLAISDRLARMMGGKLTVESQVGIGTEFTVRLPMVRAPLPVPAEQFDDETWAIGRRILVAEDDHYSALIIRELLEGLKMKVTVVENGALAVRALESHYDAVILDARMPVLDGREAARKIRAEGHELPIIGLSASVTQEDYDAAYEAGMDAYLTKPLDFDQLVTALRTRWAPGPSKALLNFSPKQQSGLYEVFVQVRDECVANLNRAIDEGDGNQVGFWAHKMINCSQMQGFAELSRACRTLESTCGDSGAWTDIESGVTLVKQLASTT